MFRKPNCVLGKPLVRANFMCDVNASGAINATDVSLVKSGVELGCHESVRFRLERAWKCGSLGEGTGTYENEGQGSIRLVLAR